MSSPGRAEGECRSAQHESPRASADARRTKAHECFLRACALDVLVRKPGNVSVASPGHGMTAQQFLASAASAAEALFERGAALGARIERAVEASWAAAGCNTNLGIVLLCAPIAVAAERVAAGLGDRALEPVLGRPDPGAMAAAKGHDAWRGALVAVLRATTLADADAAYRAIARARPAGLGRATEEDVHAPARRNLRDAMALAAARDRIARQYAHDFGEVWDIGLAAGPPGFPLNIGAGQAAPDAATVAAVQSVYLAWLASGPDSHIVRKHGEAVAQSVMTAAQAFLSCRGNASAWDREPAFAAWDAQLKAQGVNPGTCADLTVATLMLAGLATGDDPPANLEAAAGPATPP